MSIGAAIAFGAVVGLAIGIVVSVTTDVPLAPEGGLLLGAVVGWLSRRKTREREDVCVLASRSRDGEAFDLAVESQEPLTGHIEAVVRLHLPWT